MINEIANDIINSYHINKQINNNLNGLSYNNILKISSLLLLCIHNGNFNTINNGGVIRTNKNYKMEDYYLLFDFIVNNFLKNNNLYDENLYNNVLYILLSKLTMLNKGQHLLEKLDNIILNINNLDYFSYISAATLDGTFLTFKFWTNKKSYKDFDDKVISDLLINSISNSDDRIYKYLLDDISKTKKIFLQKEMLMMIKE